MRAETVWCLDAETLELFALKGKEGGTGIKQSGIANGPKLRRVMQIITDLATRPVNELRILDLACGEGLYAIEAGLRGAEVLALDARTERMDKGAQCAKRLGLTNVRFEQNDVRRVTAASHGQFDVIFFLGILYHLDVPDAFEVLDSVYEMCRQLVIIDTHVCLRPESKVEYKRYVYEGAKHREHSDDDPDSVRRGKLLSSLDNTFGFCFTKESLVRLLNATGFTSVFECNAPLEPFKPEDRITLVAIKGTRVQISAYPWLNNKKEEDIEAILRPLEQIHPNNVRANRNVLKRRLKTMINGSLRRFGYEIRHV